jgi:hypothetical protein
VGDADFGPEVRTKRNEIKVEKKAEEVKIQRTTTFALSEKFHKSPEGTPESSPGCNPGSPARSRVVPKGRLKPLLHHLLFSSEPTIPPTIPPSVACSRPGEGMYCINW